MFVILNLTFLPKTADEMCRNVLKSSIKHFISLKEEISKIAEISVQLYVVELFSGLSRFYPNHLLS